MASQLQKFSRANYPVNQQCLELIRSDAFESDFIISLVLALFGVRQPDFDEDGL